LRDLRIASLVGTGGASHRNAGFLGISLQSFIKKFCFLCLCVSLFVCNQSFVFFPKERNTTAAAAFTCAKEETKEQIFKAGCSRDGMAAGRVLYNIGFWIRETGQALDRAGCRLQGNNIFKEPCMCSETLITGFFFRSVSPLPQSSCSILFFTTFSISDLRPKDIMPALSS